jgi:ferredoxin
MTKRKIISIDEEKCTGCGKCVPNCHEGALQIIDNKARLISDLFCDGLGACIGHCPEGAMTIEEREAESYDEKKVMRENIIPQGINTIKAHVHHLKDHGATTYLNQAIEVLEEEGIDLPITKRDSCIGGCPGSKMMDFSKDTDDKSLNNIKSQLRQWPVQLHLLNPEAPYFEKADVVLAADCTAYALGDFHNHIKGKTIAIACPKLDSNKDIYVDKIASMIDNSKINTLTIIIMEVPCCGGLTILAKNALEKSRKKIPFKKIVVGIKGEIISEEWI